MFFITLSAFWEGTVYVFKANCQVPFTLDLERSNQLASSNGWRRPLSSLGRETLGRQDFRKERWVWKR